MIFSEEAHRLYRAPPAEIEKIRISAERRPLAELEEIDISVGNSQTTVDRMLLNGWRIDDAVIDLRDPPSSWDGYNRSQAFHLHAWTPLSRILMAYRSGTDEAYFLHALRIAMEWMRDFQAKHLSLPLDAAVCALVPSDESTKAWYDMAIGTRAYLIAYLLDLIAHGAGDGPCSAEFDTLFRSLIFHQELLCQPGIFRAHNNHGFYQALGQSAASRRFAMVPGFEVYVDVAQKRLDAIVDQSFFPSGVHNEHSPGYHDMVLKSLLGAVRAQLIANESTYALVRRAQEVLPWMIQPDETLVPIGDTSAASLSKVMIDAQQRGASTASLEREKEGPGFAIGHGVAAFYDAGYAFANIPQSHSPKCASYFAQIAGFHSRTHKHADHLSFVWSEGETAILVDAGRYGYAGKTKRNDELFEMGFFYSDPNRVYVEKTRAHNTVEIDERDYARKSTKAFGSALQYAGRQKDLVVTSCEMRPLRSMRHQRTIVFKPGQFITVWDFLIDQEQTDHKFRQWFHFSPRWAVERRDRNYSATQVGPGPHKVLSATSFFPEVEPTEVFRGVRSPMMQGWISEKTMSLTPAPAFAYEADGVGRARFGTLVSLSASITIERVRANMSLRHVSVEWRDDFGGHRLQFQRTAEGLVQSDYTMGPFERK